MHMDQNTADSIRRMLNIDPTDAIPIPKSLLDTYDRLSSFLKKWGKSRPGAESLAMLVTTWSLTHPADYRALLDDEDLSEDEATPASSGELSSSDKLGAWSRVKIGTPVTVAAYGSHKPRTGKLFGMPKGKPDIDAAIIYINVDDDNNQYRKIPAEHVTVATLETANA